MVSTVEFLVARYAALQGLDLQDDPILSIAQHQQERLQRIFRGRWRKTSRSYHPIHLRDLPDLAHHLLESSYFTVGLTVFRQCQGASMGSPFSTGSMQCRCTFPGILLSKLLPELFLALCHWIGTSRTLR